MKKSIYLLALALTAFAQQLLAHAVWIEATPAAVKGRPHDVHVYFGEFSHNERDTVAKWYSDIAELEIWLVPPDGKTIKLPAKAGLTSIDASFTPEADGVYTVQIHHDVKDLYHGSKLEYNASAIVVCGKAKTQAYTSNLPLLVHAEKPAALVNGNAVQLHVLANGQPAPNEKVELFTPGAEAQQLTSNAKGSLEFKPVKAGLYMAEVIHSEKTNGTHNQQAFTAVYKIATACFYIQ